MLFRSIGVHLALGARAVDILRLVLGQGMKLILAGIVLGVTGSLLLTRWMQSMLFGVPATDLATFAAVTLLLIVVGLHIAANIAYLIWKREILVRPMITGRKPAGHFEDQPAATLAGSGKAIACLAIAIAVVLGGIRLAAGKL